MRRRSPTRALERELVRAVRRQRSGQVRRGARDVDLLVDRFTVDPDWRRTEDGRAARLSPTETIEVRPVGRFADVEPLVVVTGWRSLGRALGVGVLGTAIGLSWWRGGRTGAGPLVRGERGVDGR